MAKHLVVGLGEVGKSLQRVIDCPGHDPIKGEVFSGMCDYLHIAFPYSDGFIKAVENYQKQFKPLHTVIHSTVPIGTSRICGAVHSPIRGVHPNLERGIRTFKKYFGGEGAEKVAEEFKRRGVETKCYKKPENTEAGKIWSTTQYGVMITLMREIHDWCKENDVDFDVVYTEFNQSYNAGYKDLQMGHVIRPVLKYVPGKIGGHCVVPNAKFLDTPLANMVQ